MYRALPYKMNTPKSSLFAQNKPHKYDNQVQKKIFIQIHLTNLGLDFRV
jgi:hypothetical protein